MLGEMVVDIADCDTTCFCDMELIEFVVEDFEDPLFTNPPEDLDLNCIDEVVAIEDLDWTDNCAGNGSAVGSESGSADLCSGGTYTRTWEYTDLCDNSVSHTQTINIAGTPEATFDMLPNDVNVDCVADIVASIDLNYTNSAAGDCLIEGILSSVETGAASECGGTITYTWSYTDVC